MLQSPQKALLLAWHHQRLSRRISGTALASCMQVQSQVTKLQTRLNSNLLKRVEELSNTSSNPELTADRSGLQALQQDLQRAETTLADVESKLAAVEGKSDELSKRVCLRLTYLLVGHHLMT